MKILHYIPSIDRTSGGTTTYIQLLSKELGLLADLHIATHKSQSPEKIDNCTLHYMEASGLLHLSAMKKEWIALLDNIHPDIVHINCCWQPECSMVQKWAQKKGYKVILTPHGMLEPYIIKRHYWTRKLPALMLYQKTAIKQSDCIHATAESEKENLLKLGYNQKNAVIGNGIDVDKISMKTDWTRKKQILFLSRIHVKKGIEFLIDAVADLQKELADYTINIAGEGESTYINKLQNTINEKGVANQIKLIGGIYGDDKWNLLRLADVFVLPTYSENFGLAVAEALASGTPVITTKGAPWQDLETYKCGWWTEIGVQPLVSALKEFMSIDEKQSEQMGRNGRKLIEEKYSAKKMASKMLQLYNWILGKGEKPDFVYL